MNIFKEISGTEKSPTDITQENITKVAINEENSEYDEEEGIWTIIYKGDTRVDNLETSERAHISHPSRKMGPNLMKKHDPLEWDTQASKQRMFLSTVNNSGNCPTAQQAVSRKYPHDFLTNVVGPVLDGETGEPLEYRDLIRRPEHKDAWGYSFGNETGRLAQKIPAQNNGTDTFFFIDKSKVPADRRKDIIYGKLACNIRTQKDKINRTRLIVGTTQLPQLTVELLQ
jgi:hypothetical protein